MERIYDDKKTAKIESASSLSLGMFYHPMMSPRFDNLPARVPFVADSKMPPKTLNPVHALCAVMGVTRPLTDMVRVVLSPDKIVTIDLDEKLPGQFVWVTVTKDCFKRAHWRNSFTSAFKDKVETPSDLPEKIELGLLKKALETLSLAKKSGILTHGFAKVEDWLQSGQAHVYCAAMDASEHGRKKLNKPAQGVVALTEFTSAQLSAALGDFNIMHVALKPHALTTKLQNLVHKLALIRAHVEPISLDETE